MLEDERLGVNSLAFIDLLEKGVAQWELFERVADLGISIFEVRREWLGKSDELAKMKAVSNETQLELFYSVPDLLFQGQLIEHQKLVTFFEEAAEMGAVRLKMTGGYGQNISEEDRLFFTALRKRYPDIAFTIENNQEMPYAQWQPLIGLLHLCRANEMGIGYTYDMGNFYYVNEKPDSGLEEVAAYTEVIHLKDVKADTKATVLLNQGDIQWSELIGALPANLPIVIEYPCGPEPFVTLKNELQKIKKEVR